MYTLCYFLVVIVPYIGVTCANKANNFERGFVEHLLDSTE